MALEEEIDAIIPSTEKSKIPVIILNWNGVEDTIIAVQSLVCQSLVSHIIIIDNASSNHEFEELRVFFKSDPRIVLKQNTQNLGFGKAHNEVFRLLKRQGFKYVACLNNDAIADVNWIEQMVNCVLNHEASMVASLMVIESKRDLVDTSGHQLLSTGEIIPRGQGFPIKEFSEYQEVIGACAGACLYEIDMLDKLDYFDERFFVGYEDAELGLRAWLCGYKCVFSPKAIVYHKMSSSIGKIRSTAYLSEIQSHIFYTWFKLLPWQIVVIQLPAMIFKYSMVLLIDIVFFRFKFLNVMFLGIIQTIRQSQQIMVARQTFYSEHNVERTFAEIHKNLVSFLVFDLKRFWRFVVLRKKSALEN